MEKFKISEGNVVLTNIAKELLPYAMKFYGNKYKSVVDSTLKHACIYELDENVYNHFIGKNNACSKEKSDKNSEGFYQLNDKLMEGYNHIIAVRKKRNIEKMIPVLVHELFGHAVLSEMKPFVMENGNLYIRNGIARILYSDKRVKYNIMAQEGMVEYITKEIMKLYNFKYDVDRHYNGYYGNSTIFCQTLFEIFGKEKMLELLVLNKGNINNLINPNNLSEWNEISNELEKVEPSLSIHVMNLIRRNENRRVNI